MDDTQGIKNVKGRNVSWQGVGTRLFCTSTISIQLPELIEPPLFISCLINTLLLSEAKVPRPFYLFLFLFFLHVAQRARRSRDEAFFLRFPFSPLHREPEGGSSFLLSAACRSQRPLPFQIKATPRFLPFSSLSS